jgi:type I restriction enzyme S subunit
MIDLRKESWKLVELGEVCDINIGKTPSRTNLENFGIGYTWLSIADFKGGKYLSTSKEEITDIALSTANFRLIPKGTVMLTFKLTIGKVAIAGKDLYSNEAIASLPIKDLSVLSPEYLYIVLQTIDYASKTDKAVKGATLNKQKLNKLNFLLPGLKVQEEIIELFHSIEQSLSDVNSQKIAVDHLMKRLQDGLMSESPHFGDFLVAKDFRGTTFGDLVQCDSRTSDQQADVESFIGLENIESDNFNLQGSGSIQDGTTFTKRFCSGDVLFAKRRPYLRKVAVATFDGLCSSDILVFTANHKMILKDLLPFYISSSKFISHSISTSAGSLSPRTKWRDLANLKIPLPSIDAQSQLLEIFSRFRRLFSILDDQKTFLVSLKQQLLRDVML